ncbi:hypothetical protein ACHAXH_006629 [Discostella pseudostelligera]
MTSIRDKAEVDALGVATSSTTLVEEGDGGENDEASPSPAIISNHNSDVDHGGDCSTGDDAVGSTRGDGTHHDEVISCTSQHIDDVDNAGGNRASSPCSRSMISGEITVNAQDHESNYSNDDHSYYSEDDDDDKSLGFPPGHITRMEELNVLQNHNRHPSLEVKKSVNPSIIPSYFFCPLTKTIMKDPVITPDGHTYERRAILRSLILEDCDPISRSPLSHEELTDDYLVRQAIQKARVEAWTRYAIEFQDDTYVTQNIIMSMCANASRQEDPQYYPQQAEETPNNLSQDLSTNSAFLSQSSASLCSSVDDSTSVNHGWSVPLGVHKVICSEPGLVVTTDSHQRSNAVKRKILLKSLVEKNKADTKKIHLKRMKMKNNIKTVTTVITRDLIIPPGSYVDILETCVHGGRIRGRIVWEEELATENNLALSMRLAELELRKNASIRTMKPPNSSPLKGKNIRSFFHRKSSSGATNNERHEDAQPHGDGHSRSLSPVSTIEYTGWISLQWVEGATNYERDETLKRRESSSRSHQTTTAVLATDEDEGPWTQPLPLGVYRVCGDSSMDDTYAGNHDVGISAKQLPLYDAPDCKNMIDFLVPNQCIEIVETKVLVVKRNGHDRVDAGRQAVRARCMVPMIATSTSSSQQNHDAPIRSQRQFRHGWITINGEGKELVSASQIPFGAYIVTANSPVARYDANSMAKSVLHPGSCIEVVNTRLEFEDGAKRIQCGCGKEGMYNSVSIRALIASGGYVTLFDTSVGTDGACVCGNIVQNAIYADPVPLGTYRLG